MKSTEVKDRFLKFFESKGHKVIPSAPLVPENDPTVLFTTAGMHPLVPYLLGEPHPEGKRLVNIQKCLRTDDIEEVGDTTHNTFFLMLGNWSLGEYFKKEAIGWSWEFLTEELKLDPKKISVSVFAGDKTAPKDEEAAKIWQEIGIPKSRIKYLPKEDNWWGPAGTTGPCGPDTEMFYDVNGEEVEIWNDVFMEYNKTADGMYEPLVQKNVDTGMGLERVAVVLQGKKNIYETDLFSLIIETIRQNAKERDTHAERVIADHTRAAVFLIFDGVVPSNAEQGYVLRRLIRRAIVHANKIGVIDSESFMREVAGSVFSTYEELFPELSSKKAEIIEKLVTEAGKFKKTLDRGLREFDKLAKKELTGEIGFILKDTYGFPKELSLEVAKEKDIKVSKDFDRDFDSKLEEQRQRSRTATAGQFKGGLADHSEVATRYHTATHLMYAGLRKFLGNHVTQRGSNITAERTRFDFSHGEKVSKENLKKVEDFVNEAIRAELPVRFDEMTVDEARKLGAIGTFDEKYGGKVKVYTVGDTAKPYSREFCGGPHVTNTKEIGLFKIVKEEASSAGVRRIKAVIE